MKKRMYWKELWLSIRQSKGRFFSIFSLMTIGSMALIGLKVTTPNMERTAQNFVDSSHLLDVAVMADYGLDEADVKELSSLPKAQVEFGYMEDATIAGSHRAVRIYSQTKTISQFQLKAGRFPTATNEIALAEDLAADVQLGDQLSFSLGEKSSLKQSTYTVVGFVRSSEIWDKKAMGPSSVGTGELTGYAVTLPEAFDSSVYMIARIRYDDLASLAYYSPTYQTKLHQHQKDLENKLSDNGKKRLATLQAESQKKVDAGQAEVDASEKKLTEAGEKIEDGEGQIANGKDQIASAKEKVDGGENRLARSQKELAAAKAKLDATAQTLATTKAQLDSQKTKLDETKSQLDTITAQLATVKSNLDTRNQELSTLGGQIAEAQRQLHLDKTALDKQIKDLEFEGKDPYSMPDIQAAQTAIQDREAQLAERVQSYEANYASYQADFSQYQAQESLHQASLEAYEEGKTQYQTGLSQYEAGLAQYQTGLSQYEAGLAQYEASQSELNAAKSAISAQEDQVKQAEEDLSSVKQAYQEEAGDAKQKIQGAKEDLNQAQTAISDLQEPSYSVYQRSTLPTGIGYRTYGNATRSIAAVGNIFPVVLYLVAALVTFTTMTRFVDEERGKIGIFRALGYRKGHIINRFVLYGLLASFLGTLVGIIAGNFFLSPIIGNIITKTIVVGQAHLYFYPSWTFFAFGLALLSAVLPTYLVARKELNQEPAKLLLAKPPVSGSKILLEKLPFIWRRLSFTHKVTARNIFRYKLRMFMTIFGVAGSVALLFAGLGIQSSISGVAETQFGELLTHDMMVVQKDKSSPEEQEKLHKLLQSDKVKKSRLVQLTLLSETLAGQNEAMSINLMIAPQEALKGFILLRTRNKEPISLGDKGAVLTEKLAELYGVKKGEKLTLHLNGKSVQIRVAAIAETYTGHFIYMSPSYYKQVTGENDQPNTHLIILKDRTNKNVQAMAADFLPMAKPAGVVQNTALIATIHTVAQSLQTVMLILIVLSILLAMVILYNLTNINVAERVRELSTIRVLGFHNQEVTLYIYRETILLALIGILTGLGLGRVLHRIILRLIGSATIMFKPEVGLWVYALPVLSIVGILTVLGFFVNYKLRHIDMMEALQSGE